MAITAIQLYDPDFLSQLSSEYICTGFMFDENIQMESLESKLSKGGFIPGVDVQEAKKTFVKMDIETNRQQALKEAHAKAFAMARKAYTKALAEAGGRLDVSFKQFTKDQGKAQAEAAAIRKDELMRLRQDAPIDKVAAKRAEIVAKRIGGY